MISLFTASHDSSFLSELNFSLLAQTYTDWQWVILLNGTAEFNTQDPRVKIVRDNYGIADVGFLKRRACELCDGDILFEMDHDDILLPTALEECAKAFEDPTVTFAYSNTINHNVQNNQPVTWSSHFGWSQRDVEYKGQKYIESISADPDPQSISRIWFAPNHFRAWRTDFYWKIGGHDATMKISDDHDLMCRTYIHGKMVHIDKPLYLYRVHGKNTWLQHGQAIEDTMWACHDKYFEAMMLRWAKDKGLRCIDMCGGVNPAPGYETMDRTNAHIIADLNKRWPLSNNTVGVLRAHDAIEHLVKPIHTMNEAHRVLAHGGFFDIMVPSTDGQGAFCDPTHVSFWNSRSFRYYTNRQYARFIPDYHGRFQQIKMVNTRMWDDIPYVMAHLIALKTGPRYYGEVLI